MPHPRLQSIRIVLVEPAGALNVGSVARVMKNMGLQQLVLVQPHCDPVGAEARLMAVHAPEILENAQIVETLPQALVGCQRAIATTGKPDLATLPLEPPRQAFPWLLTAPPEQPSAIIFGPEDRGLTIAELHHAHRWVCIPTHPDYPSLNLAQAVAICAYELAQQAELATLGQLGTATWGKNPIAETAIAPAPLDHLEGLYGHLERVLLDIGYLYPHTATSRMQKFRRLLHRALPSTEETAMLRGILSQVEWALQHRDKKP